MTRMDDSLTEEGDYTPISPDIEIRHVYPLEDITEHEIESANCPCGPYLQFHKDILLVIHRVWDRSEKVEFFKDVHGEVVL